jgi:hypothetical protein
MDEADETEKPGNGSLNFVANIPGDECAEVGLLIGLLVTLAKLVCKGDVGCRRGGRGKVLCIGGGKGDDAILSSGSMEFKPGDGRGEISSSAYSEIVSEIDNEPSPRVFVSSDVRRGLFRRTERSMGLVGLPK